jgi:hypothetical protein
MYVWSYSIRLTSAKPLVTRFGEADALLHSWGTLGVAGPPRFLGCEVSHVQLWAADCEQFLTTLWWFFKYKCGEWPIYRWETSWCTQNWWLSIATLNRGYEFLCFFWCFLLVCKFRGLLWGTPIWWFLKLLFFRENNHLEVCPHFTTPRSCQTPKTPLGLLWRKRHHIARRDFHRDPIQWDPMGYHARI